MKKCMRIVLAVFAVAAVLALAPKASAQNLVQNSGFETGTFAPNWNNSLAPAWNPGNWAIDTLNPHSGLGEAHLFFDGGLSQNVQGIVAGQSYNFSGWSYVESGGDMTGSTANGWGSFLQLRWLNASGNPIGANVFDLDIEAQTRDQWNQSIINGIVAPTGATQARLLFGTFTSNINPLDPGQGVHTVAPSYWDDMSLTVAGIPEPGTYAMLAIGLGLLVPVVRRRLQA